MKYAIVTGGSSGLGLETARQLAKKGLNLIVVGRQKEKLGKALYTIKQENPACEILDYEMDIADEAQVKLFFDDLRGKDIEVEYLFNIAGAHHYGWLPEVTAEALDHVLKANLIGLVHMTSKCVAYMQSDSLGQHRIVSVLSTAALKGKKGESLYNASKWGARGFLESVRDELTSTNIDVINIFPGGMRTAFWDNSTSGYDTSRFMDPGDVARQIINAVMDYSVWVTDVTINRNR